jgi:hypothetical protein
MIFMSKSILLQVGEFFCVQQELIQVYSSFDESVIEDLRFLEASPYISKDTKVRGFVLDLATGQLKEVFKP